MWSAAPVELRRYGVHRQTRGIERSAVITICRTRFLDAKILRNPTIPTDSTVGLGTEVGGKPGDEDRIDAALLEIAGQARLGLLVSFHESRI